MFDFAAIRALCAGGFTMRCDGMHAVSGPYAHAILEGMLGAPAGTVSPDVSTIRISGPPDGPTVPGFRVPGGSGLLAIWCAASVIPYASIIGTR